MPTGGEHDAGIARVRARSDGGDRHRAVAQFVLLVLDRDFHLTFNNLSID